MTTGAATKFEDLHSLVCSRLNQMDPNKNVDCAGGFPRSQVLHLGACVGKLCSSILTHAPLDCSHSSSEEAYPSTSRESHPFWSSPSLDKDEIAKSMGHVFIALHQTAQSYNIDLRVCILKKMILNAKKYPVELCKGKSGKYTAYSSQTGITETEGQSTLNIDVDCDEEKKEEFNDLLKYDTYTVQGITLNIRKFATDRKWTRYHMPRNICLALLGELGELAEIFQWDGDEKSFTDLQACSEEKLDHMKQELADVSIYLIRLSDVCGIDLGNVAKALLSKF